ncbi:cytokine-dependent hematopoietic cell linker [Podargus strigoides]
MNMKNISSTPQTKNKDLAIKGKSDLQSCSKAPEEEESEYETVSSSTLEAIHALRIVPAKPLQESEYAGERMKIHGTQDPVPPPRPLKTLPKQHQPLPPEPKTSSQFFHMRKMLSQAHTLPISAKVTSLIKNAGMCKILDCIFEAVGRVTLSQASGSTLNVENPSVKRSPSPMPYRTCKDIAKHSLAKWEMQSLTQPTEKDLKKYEWYAGEYDRHEAEKALLQENTDETFLVRDCSKKSTAEPYVLVVYYGRRVYNIKVRFLEESQQYVLGTGLRGDDKFNSVEEIIDFYKYVPITLIDGRDKSGIQREQCYLTYPFKSRKRCFLP